MPGGIKRARRKTQEQHKIRKPSGVSAARGKLIRSFDKLFNNARGQMQEPLSSVSSFSGRRTQASRFSKAFDLSNIFKRPRFGRRFLASYLALCPVLPTCVHGWRFTTHSLLSCGLIRRLVADGTRSFSNALGSFTRTGVAATSSGLVDGIMGRSSGIWGVGVKQKDGNKWWLGIKRMIFGDMYVQNKYAVRGPMYRKPFPRETNLVVLESIQRSPIFYSVAGYRGKNCTMSSECRAETASTSASMRAGSASMRVNARQCASTPRQLRADPRQHRALKDCSSLVKSFGDHNKEGHALNMPRDVKPK
ncbi:hypothetical protein B0H17DRAFT_1185992 [Mycena rosella]|uniref:Uncharacterized protein n=1 Tax=Mycena rosella TaxID=1033263 RepID=A0AAD7CP50_MYCRO|nr:hypothetical protein B0H17DRAFT_1185992 [Mycena rosella]